jgi:Flp pilus assembly protein TadB
MRSQPRHHGPTLGWLTIVGVAILAAIALVLVVVPGAEPAVVAIGAVLTLIVYAIWYVIERRRHW